MAQFTGKANPLVPLEKIQTLVSNEAAVLLLSFSFATYLFYKIFLRDTNAQRHKNLGRHFRNLAGHCLFGAGLYGVYYALERLYENQDFYGPFVAYVGLAVLIEGLIIFIKAARILLFEYLFLSHMKAAVPLLLINLFTLILTAVLGAWLLSEIFNIRLAPLMATSAVFSLILGLAMQDTLGNLFAGVALQIDKPYELGDWIELNHDGQKWVGQVYEISWRATVLLGYADELITIPNRTASSSQILTFATRLRPVARSLTYRVPFGTDTARLKDALIESARHVRGVRSDMKPQALLAEAAESWLAIRLFYFIDDFGQALTIADRVNEAALATFAKMQVTLATPRLEVSKGRDVA